MSKLWIPFAALLLAFAAPVAAAQTASGAASQAANKAVATVRTDGGVVMVSEQNGPFATATPNEAVASGDRLMVAKDSIATVIYNDGCDQKYDKPGIYKIEPSCKRAAAVVTGGSGWTTGQMVVAAVGGAVLGGAIIDRRCNCHCPPVSR